MNGDYKKSRTRRQVNGDDGKGSYLTEDGPYLELDDQLDLGSVRVTREVKIDSRKMSVRDIAEP